MLQNFKNKITNVKENKAFSIKLFNSNLKKKAWNEYKNIIYYPSSTKEWINSVYTYNKSYIKSLIVYDVIVNYLLGSYANSIKTRIQRFKRRRNNKIRYSANKLYLSKAELKHTNSKVIVILYLFNKQKLNIQSFLVTLSKYLKANIYTVKENKRKNKGRFINNTLFKHVVEYTDIKKKKIYMFTGRLLYKINNYKILKKNNYISFKREYNGLAELFLEKNTLTNDNIPYINKLRAIFKEENALLDTATNLNFNTFKFSDLILTLGNLGILRLLEKIYRKNVEFKVVDLKSVHLNSGVFSSAVALKLRDRHNKAVTVLRKAIIQMVRIPDLHTLITFDDNKPFMNKNNILNTISQQVVSGVRFEASGRLTRRLTAMRAVFKYRYVGSLKNVRSSFNSKPSTILRGVVKSNAQYTLINSKTRNGTFGLKG
jgi:hypothetical protein